jgi:hypothetical protein
MGTLRPSQGPYSMIHSFRTCITILIHPLVGALVTKDAKLTKV